MSDMVIDAGWEAVDAGPSQFFAPVASDLVDGLVGQYQAMRTRIEKVAALFEGDLAGVVHYFIEGNRSGDGSRYSSITAEKIFQRDGAIAALNSSYWSQALKLTDVYEYMPQARRNEWDKSVREMTCPEFDEGTVRSTLVELLNSRSLFFAERVDGIFRGLSGHHVTNAPEAFGKRMIIAGVINSWGSSESCKVGLISDLRCVIAKFMGRDEPRWNSSSTAIEAARHRSGEWITLDGGTLRLRVYKIGTAHLEVHPDMAWRLNAVLAQLHPLAIPAQFRQKPKRVSKEWAPMERPLPNRVLEVLAEVKAATEKIPGDWRDRRREVPCTLAMYGSSSTDKAVLAEARRVMEAIGGVPSAHGLHWTFEIPNHASLALVKSIVITGTIPDKVSHQFYPTPDGLAQRCVDLAEIVPTDTCLEPSAGQGAIAGKLSAGTTTAVEISELHCAILKAKFAGAVDVVHADFLAQAEAWQKVGRRFDKVVMNPPFADGRAKAHTEAAAALIAPGGRLVAILPSGMKGSDFLEGDFAHEWHGPFENEFAGTSVAVCILVARRAS